jgi:putative membrane protein
MYSLQRPLLTLALAGVVSAFALPGSAAQGMGSSHTYPSNAGDMSPAMAPTDDAGDHLRGPDRDFAMDAARGGMAEVELGKLAVAKATNPDVRNFGQRMIDDHGKANDQLRQVASDRGLALPSDLDRKSRDEMRRLDKLSGPQFDRAYVDMMVKDHVKDVADFQREARRGDSPVQRFASSTLPTLQEHLSMAKDLQTRVSASLNPR